METITIPKSEYFDLIQLYQNLTIRMEKFLTYQKDVEIQLLKNDITDGKATDWDLLEELITPFRKGLPKNYKFDRELANER